MSDVAATALIIGADGQDGRYLRDQLSQRGYRVLGLARGAVRGDLAPDYTPVDITERDQVFDLVGRLKPDRVFFLAAIHHSAQSAMGDEVQLFADSFAIHTASLTLFVEAMRRLSPHSRLLYAASSHVFGSPETCPQDETTPFRPICAYGISKTAGIHICQAARYRYDLHCSAAILYNHESPLRPSHFLSKKVVRAAVAIKRGSTEKLVLGNLDALADWGYAPDTVDAMIRILDLDQADDYVVATGRLHSVRDFVQAVFDQLELDWRAWVEVDPSVLTKITRRTLQGDSTRLKLATGWIPTHDLADIARIMVTEELRSPCP